MAANFELNWSTWHDYCLLGVDALCAALLYAVYRRRDKVINNILDAPTLLVGSELSELLHGVPEGEVPYAVIRGRVKEVGQTIESSSGLKTVMQVVTLNEHSYKRSALNQWGDNVKVIHQANNAVPFCLTDPSTSSNKKSGFRVEVENAFDADEENLFLTVSTNFTPSNTSVASTVMGFFTGVAVRGVERTEEVLPVDTVVTGIGRLIKDANGHIKLVPPKDEVQYRYILSTLPVESIIKKLESRNTILKLSLVAVLSVGAIVVVRRIKSWWRERQMTIMREVILRERSAIDLEGLSEIQICTICLANPREVILLNCGHVCVCADCCVKLNDKCPVCRRTIVSTHPAYLA